jgi:hypothetical protein
MRALLFCTLLAAFAPGARAGDTLRCGSRVVATEAPIAEVLAACGEPDYRDRWRVPPHFAADEEQWYYNFGANRFVQILGFRHGLLVSVEADGYGFDDPPNERCAPMDIVRGLSKLRLLHRCGQPATQESYDELRPLRRRDGGVRHDAARPVRRELWTYDFGPDTRMRIVTLKNGRVTDVESGALGSAAVTSE